MTVHISGQCKFKDCDKPSVIEGYCAFHYNLINQQRTNNIMNTMIELLGTVNSRLINIEDKLQNNSTISYDNQVKPNSAVNNSIIKQQPPTSLFIPSTIIEGDVDIKGLKTKQIKRNIKDIANQLNDIPKE